MPRANTHTRDVSGQPVFEGDWVLLCPEPGTYLVFRMGRMGRVEASPVRPAWVINHDPSNPSSTLTELTAYPFQKLKKDEAIFFLLRATGGRV